MTENDVIVSIEDGKLRGAVGTLLNGEQYYIFKGIPYATPPVGDLRFRAPLPPKPWHGIRDATRHGPICPQFDMYTLQAMDGTEDCLYLNVYTKTLLSHNITSKSPVMVFIHGGGFMSGSGDDSQYGPQFLVPHDVVLVTLNYRLEVLGFLALDIPEVPGNAGLKDQVLALKWVKKNIDKFGGDSENITLFGESAGAASVTYHMLSPMSKGLFHRAIAQSGTCLQDWAIADRPKERAFRIAKVLGKETKDINKLLQLLRSVPVKDLIKMTIKTLTLDERRRGIALHFVPNIEKVFDNVEAFISDDPINLLLAENFTKVPLMIGYNSDEGLLSFQGILKKSKILNSEPYYLTPRDIYQRVTEIKTKEFGDRILKFYTGDKGINNDTKYSVVDFATDAFFGYQTHRFAHLYNTGSIAPVYMYRFEYDTDMNILKSVLGLQDMKGACHADDLFYLFYNALNKYVYEEQESVRSIVHRLTKMWTDFAKTGNPTPDHVTSLQWLPLNSSSKPYLALNDQLSMKTSADHHRMQFWNTLYRDAGLPCIVRSNL